MRISPRGWMRALAIRWRAAPTLGEVVADRRNNLDLVRLVAALAVIWGHATFFVPDTYEHPDPAAWISGGREYSGSVAVHAFFLVSGILVSASMDRHGTVERFLVARFARLWPGFMACVAVLACLVVPLASRQAPFSRAHLRAAGACLRLDAFFPFGGVCDSLPGAFPTSPVKDAFGFPYWTLVTETHCYAMALALGAVAGSRFVPARLRTVVSACGIAAFLAGFLLLSSNPPADGSPFLQDVTLYGGYSVRPVPFFLAGMALHLFRRSVRVSMPLAAGLAALSLVPAAPVALGYVAFAYGTLAVAAARPLRILRPRHDLSFGIYVYGAAMQQVAVTMTGPAPPWVNFAIAAPLSAAFAYASWRLVEAPSIEAGRALVAALPGRTARPSGSVPAARGTG